MSCNMDFYLSNSDAQKVSSMIASLCIRNTNNRAWTLAAYVLVTQKQSYSSTIIYASGAQKNVLCYAL